MLLVALLAMQIVYTLAAFVSLALLLAVTPWVVVRSTAFHARSSVFRNVPFRLEASMKEAYAVFFGGQQQRWRCSSRSGSPSPGRRSVWLATAGRCTSMQLDPRLRAATERPRPIWEASTLASADPASRILRALDTSADAPASELEYLSSHAATRDRVKRFEADVGD